METAMLLMLKRLKTTIKYLLDKTNADDVPEILDKMNNFVVEVAETLLKSCKKQGD